MNTIERVVKAICGDTHLKCTFPDCGCNKSTERKAKAAVQTHLKCLIESDYSEWYKYMGELTWFDDDDVNDIKAILQKMIEEG